MVPCMCDSHVALFPASPPHCGRGLLPARPLFAPSPEVMCFTIPLYFGIYSCIPSYLEYLSDSD